MSVSVFALASCREGGKKVLKSVKQSSQQASRLTTIWVDGGFDGEVVRSCRLASESNYRTRKGEPFMRWVMDFCRWIVQVVLRPEQTKGFMLLKKRWVVERTYGKAHGVLAIGQRL